MGHTLPKFQFHRFSLLPDSQRLIEKYSQLLLREILQEGNGFFGKILDEAAQAMYLKALSDLLGQLPHQPLNPVGLLIFHLISQSLPILFHFLLDL